MNEVVKTFEENHLAVFKELADNKKLLKQCEEKEKNLKAQLEAAMDKYGITLIDNQYLKLQFMVPTASTTVDLKKLAEKEPELYRELVEDYPKETKKKAHTRMTIK